VSAAPGISLNFVSDSSPWPQERPARRRRGKTGAKKKSSAKKTSAAEPPTLTPAAGFVSGESQGSRPSLYEFLRDRGYLIDRTSADLMNVVLELPGIRAVLLEGPPGVGKTALTEKIAQWLGAEYIYVLATPNTDEDVLLYKFVPDENTKSGIRVAEGGPVTQAVKKAASGRKVIYVGDFDGANTPIELSWRNEVIWIAPESRYRRFLSHSWVKYDEAKHKGAFIRAFTIGDIMKSLKKVLGGARWIDMCKKCEDEQS
jgi:hypothetical protein